MSNHCRQIWPQVVYTSSKTADNTHSFSLPIPCRLCSSKEAQSDNKAHRKNTRILFFIVHMDQHCSTFKSISLFFLLNHHFLVLNIIYTLFYVSLVTAGHSPTSGWQQAWARSHFVSCYINVTWRHIIYSSNCWHPNRALNGDTLILFLCAWADTHAKRRRLTKGSELDVLLTGYEWRRAHTSRPLLLLHSKSFRASVKCEPGGWYALYAWWEMWAEDLAAVFKQSLESERAPS